MSIWLPDANPTSAGSEDDEFRDASGGVPSGWTEVDHDTILTVTEDAAGLLMVDTGNNASVAGIYKAIPAGDFTVWTKVSWSQTAGLGPNQSYGMALWEDPATTTADIATISIAIDAVSFETNIQTATHTAYNSAPAATAGGAIGDGDWPTHIYMRIRRATAQYSMDASIDGVAWLQINTFTLGYTPSSFGLFMINTHAGAVDSHGRFHFFRYVASNVGLTGLVNGDRVNFVGGGGPGKPPGRPPRPPGGGPPGGGGGTFSGPVMKKMRFPEKIL